MRTDRKQCKCCRSDRNKISMEEYKRYLKDYDYFDKKKFVKNRKEKYEAD